MSTPIPTSTELTRAAAVVGGFDRNTTRYLGRELSWLAFNARVLAYGFDRELPLLERAKFAAIFPSNLDEFFQVRVAGLKDQLEAGISTTGSDGRTPGDQLRDIRSVVDHLSTRHSDLFEHELAPALGRCGIRLHAWTELSHDEQTTLTAVFEGRVYPILTPLAVDPGHPFPYVSDLSLNLAVVLSDPATGARHLARVKVPGLLPRLVPVAGRDGFVWLEELIAAHLGRLFVGMEIVEHHAFRVTRNADLIVDDEGADDLLAAVEMELRQRRFGRAIRLEVASTMGPELVEWLRDELDLGSDDVYVSRAPLDLTALWQVISLDRPDLVHPPFAGVAEPELVDNGEPNDIFAAIRAGDILLHHPYSSFVASVVQLLRQAAADPQVQAIKMTLYRTAGESLVVEGLIAAAEAGKQVAVLIELTARFDEAANIAWARRMERAGVHVSYGFVGLKTHAKICLVVRDEADGLRRYCHLGTGNYNHRTAAIYEDFGLLTADPVVGDDVNALMNSLTGYGRGLRYERLLVAPDGLRPALVDLIAAEAEHPGGRIVIKCNNVVDRRVIDALYDASQAGVEIDLIVRGICCLRPGVPGLSERIRVRSLIGQYLEHSRVYLFANGEGLGEAAVFIGSADLMERNLDRRVEALVRICDRSVRDRLAEALGMSLSDDHLAWSLAADGTWTRASAPHGFDVQVAFQAQALQRAAGGDASTG